MDSKVVARGLAAFGIGLGLAEVFANRAFSRAIGLEQHAAIVRLFGFREIVSGLVIIPSGEPERWLWLRVVGDALDGALLGTGLVEENPLRQRTLLATLAVTPIALLDALYALRSFRDSDDENGTSNDEGLVQGMTVEDAAVEIVSAE